MAASTRWAKRDRWGRPSPAGRTGRRVAALLTAVVMVVSVAGQSAWASPGPVPAPVTPQQRSGSAAGLPHDAGSAIAPVKGGAAPATPAGAANVTGVASGSEITYPGVAAHTDVSYLATVTGGVKETLNLTSGDVSTTWVFPLALTGVTPSMGPDGSVLFTNAAGQVVDTIAHGFMRESNIDPRSDEGVLSTGVTYALTTVNGQPALQVTLDSAWLHDKARVFPVRVDPSIANVNT